MTLTYKSKPQAKELGIYKVEVLFCYPLPPPRMDAKPQHKVQLESLPLELCPVAFLTQQNFYLCFSYDKLEHDG